MTTKDSSQILSSLSHIQSSPIPELLVVVLTPAGEGCQTLIQYIKTTWTGHKSIKVREHPHSRTRKHAKEMSTLDVQINMNTMACHV